ncbi:MAG: FtsX-like permease family protein [Spirochaetaceae bacterium]|jgi:ABC-type lipoprotein release transport system permease subunit|nr:FtsX-like permease family protein [Spirochaetaceae bacterium]
MRIQEAFKLSLKYLLRYRRRYLFLFCALTFGFCIVTVIVSIKDGMAKSMYYSAQGHYAGDIVILGDDSNSAIDHLSQEYLQIIKNAMDTANIKPSRMVQRTRYFGNANIFHNGETALARYLFGLDWDRESEYLENLPWAAGKEPESGAGEGGASNGADKKHATLAGDSILLSQPIAQKINAQPGDRVILEIENRYRQKNTASFIVAGIFAESSVFGMYKSFIDRKAMNELAGFESDECSLIGLYFARQAAVERSRQKLQRALETALASRPEREDKFQIADIAYNRSDWEAQKDREWPAGIVVYLLTLPVFLSDVTNILQALNILTLLLYIMMLIIIFASAAVTCRLILHERTREIATMRAIGFHQTNIVFILVLEMFFLATLALIAGFGFTFIINKMLAFLSFEWFPGMDMFLRKGRLQAVFKAGSMLFNCAAIYAMLLAAVFSPACRTARAPLPDMLAGSVKE